MPEGPSSPSGTEREPSPPLPEAPAAPEAKVEAGTVEKPTTEAEQTPKKEHAIETHTVGIPGEEKLVADTATGDQVGVRRFEVGDVTDVKRTAIEEGEQTALQSLGGKSVEEKGAIAKGAVESSKVEAGDMAEISKLLEGKRDVLLVVDAATIKDKSIPKEGLHLLIPKGELEKVEPRLQELGYSTKEIEQMGLEAEKGRSRFVFLYAKEKGEKQPENIVDHLRAKKEEQIKDIENFDLRNIGYSEQDLAQNEKFRNTFERYVEESGDDPKRFLDLLAQQGIHIVEKSNFLASQQSSKQFLGKHTGEGESGVNALFATQEMVGKYLSGDVPEAVRKELTDAQKSSGVIFLSKRPNPKSIFHEGAHAVQHLSKMNMEARDEETRLRREVEVNTALIHAKNSGKLKEVSRGAYETKKSRVKSPIFGDTMATLSANDIYQEVEYFQTNRSKLEEIIHKKKG